MSQSLQRGIQLFNEGEFFECHEVLEDIWTPERGHRRLFLQSIIHVAVGLYHHHRGNPIGAEKQLRKGLKKLAAYLPEYEDIDTGRLYRDAETCLDRVLRGAPVEDPIIVRPPRQSAAQEPPHAVAE